MTPSSLPTMQLLSNGCYHVMVMALGGGYSRCNGVALTRWHGDAGGRGCGSRCYLRDEASGQVWATMSRPFNHASCEHDASFEPGRATLHTRCLEIATRTDITVAPDDDVELRRLHITNLSPLRRTLTLTSYAEIVLEAQAADNAHPAFEKLFVETEVMGPQTLICTRRARSPNESAPVMFHRLVAPEAFGFSHETDRMRFIGRGRSTDDPQALDNDAALSGSVGAVLDPVVAIRCRVILDPGQTTVIDYFTGIGASRQAGAALAARCGDPTFAHDLAAKAGHQARNVLAQIKASEADTHLFAHLAAALLIADPRWRASADVLARNRLGQPGLWALSISGDLPIVLLQVDQPSQMDLVRQLMRAQAWWRRHGLAADLVIVVNDLNAGPADRQAQIVAAIADSGDAGLADKPGGSFVRATSAISQETRVLLQSMARIVIDASAGSLEAQVEQRCAAAARARALPPAVPTIGPPEERAASKPAPDPLAGLLFANGLGGFTPDGREYAITVSAARMTPLPWINVLANPQFGTLVSESGSACTWSENAQAFRLTPWSNDPVADPNTEAFYLRDEDSGHFWSPTLLPSAGTGPYVTRHGFGYSVFAHDEDGIDSTLTMFVAIDAPIKFAVLSLRNRSGRARRLSATGYLEWVLGDEREKTAMHVGTVRGADCQALFAHNPTNTDFAGRTAFFDVDVLADDQISACGDRLAFLGPEGSLRRPAAMGAARLSGAVGFALDPCAALRVSFDLHDGQMREIVFRLGAGTTTEEARALVQRWRGAATAQEALAAVQQHWTRLLGAIQVRTPDKSFDLLANGWLAYQTLACRYWARNAFYQSSGAFGFRDQLQDVMALVHAAPALVREHLLRCAARQFSEGDVQHWWHPPSGRGVRTRCSDDYLWLPLAACRYVSVTGDAAVLDEQVSFLSGSALEDGQASCYELPKPADGAHSLYVHCVRAIEHGLRFGEHGLPLMGGGDWNDGMNLVGAGGRGESVWLGFFLCTVLTQFAGLARQRGDTAFAERCAAESARLQAAIAHSAWDGAWYRRGWFDDGSPLGTTVNAECRIDSIAQSWSVLCGRGDGERMRQAMDAVDTHLVHRDAALVQLLDPPFDHSDPSPGYIQGYVRGVRENGGQYTHAAVWAAMAFAALGDARRTWELFTMLDPIRHADSAPAIALYKVEPYVIASDVYALPPHSGRGGWTWYTGSAGWMLRFMLESVLGLSIEADQLCMTPCCPEHWSSFELNYRYRDTLYRIKVQLSSIGAPSSGWSLDGVACPAPAVTLVDDHREHLVIVRRQRKGE